MHAQRICQQLMRFWWTNRRSKEKAAFEWIYLRKHSACVQQQRQQQQQKRLLPFINMLKWVKFEKNSITQIRTEEMMVFKKVMLKQNKQKIKPMWLVQRKFKNWPTSSDRSCNGISLTTTSNYGTMWNLRSKPTTGVQKKTRDKKTNTNKRYCGIYKTNKKQIHK